MRVFFISQNEGGEQKMKITMMLWFSDLGRSDIGSNFADFTAFDRLKKYENRY